MTGKMIKLVLAVVLLAVPLAGCASAMSGQQDLDTAAASTGTYTGYSNALVLQAGDTPALLRLRIEPADGSASSDRTVNPNAAAGTRIVIASTPAGTVTVSRAGAPDLVLAIVDGQLRRPSGEISGWTVRGVGGGSCEEPACWSVMVEVIPTVVEVDRLA